MSIEFWVFPRFAEDYRTHAATRNSELSKMSQWWNLEENFVSTSIRKSNAMRFKWGTHFLNGLFFRRVIIFQNWQNKMHMLPSSQKWFPDCMFNVRHKIELVWYFRVKVKKSVNISNKSEQLNSKFKRESPLSLKIH